ncbi:hypothetical protein AB4G91_06290 [Macrococcoides goetzii]|uniref:hypothetical protein n=1 Tax=Macrococcus sp. PK TaxID=2801919 RepID=UPI001F11322C|nr:hypothetical protein [Macrococcus sp. PK]
MFTLVLAANVILFSQSAYAADSIKKAPRTVGTHTFVNDKYIQTSTGPIYVKMTTVYKVSKTNGPVYVDKVTLLIQNSSRQTPYSKAFYIDKRNSDSTSRYSNIMIAPKTSKSFSWDANTSDAQSVNLHLVTDLAFQGRTDFVTGFY